MDSPAELGWRAAQIQNFRSKAGVLAYNLMRDLHETRFDALPEGFMVEFSRRHALPYVECCHFNHSPRRPLFVNSLGSFSTELRARQETTASRDWFDEAIV